MARSCACAGAVFGQSGTTMSSTDGGLSEVSRIGCRQRHQGVDNAVEGKSADIGGRERRGRLAFQAPAPAGGPTGGDVNPLKSNVPLSTHVLVVGVMLLFLLSATLITLQASWQWWLSAVT